MYKTANSHSRSTKVLKIKQIDHNDKYVPIKILNELETITKEDGKRTLLHRISQSMVGSKANMKALIKLLNIQNSHQGLGNMSNIDIST